MFEKVVDKFKSEPLRLRLYALVSLVALYLVSKGVISMTDVEFIVGVAGVVLAVETARRKVQPLHNQDNR